MDIHKYSIGTWKNISSLSSGEYKLVIGMRKYNFRMLKISRLWVPLLKFVGHVLIRTYLKFNLFLHAGGVRKKNPIAHLIAHTCCALAYIKIAYIAHTKCKIAHIAHTKIIPFLLHLELLKRYLKALPCFRWLKY